MRAIDLTGKKFGKLTVIEFEFVKNKRRYWKCKCDCGNIKIVQLPHLTSGHTQSCGCLHKEKVKQLLTKHGKYYSRLYSIWINIKDRCYNHKSLAYKHYGGRGINVCNEWLNKEEGFINFYNWAMENGYQDNLTIERINVNSDYNPFNCKWITKSEQQQNKRNNVFITYKNKTLNIAQWSKELKIPYYNLQRRLKQGMSFENAIKNIDYRKNRGKNNAI